jgi:predicted RNA-binding protein (virulence factor B family)
MAELGKYNTLRVVKELDFGIYLDGDEMGEILMPRRYVPENCQPDDELEAFLYLDSEDRLIATTDKPLAEAGEFACLKVVAITGAGAFLDWGLPKDLLLPYREQQNEVEEGQAVFVYVYVDKESKRLVASSKIEKHVDNLPVYYKEGDEVDAIVWTKTDLGYKVILENLYSGMLYKNEVFQELKPGQKIMAYVKKVRDDEKIDLVLEKPGYEKIDAYSQTILKYLDTHDGFMPFNDKSPADGIQATFAMSKKNFKKALGALYKKKVIIINDEGVKKN